MNYDEMIERLSAVVENDAWILVWADHEPRGVVASFNGTLERADSDDARAAWRAHIADTFKRDGMPEDMIEEVLHDFDELSDAVTTAARPASGRQTLGNQESSPRPREIRARVALSISSS